MADETENKPAEETTPPVTDPTHPAEPPKPGPVPGTQEFNDEVKAGNVVHAPDPTGKSPGQVQEEEREKDENDKSKK